MFYLLCDVIISRSLRGAVMIKSFKHKGLEQYFRQGITRGLRIDHIKKINGILDVIDRATGGLLLNLLTAMLMF